MFGITWSCRFVKIAYSDIKIKIYKYRIECIPTLLHTHKQHILQMLWLSPRGSDFFIVVKCLGVCWVGMQQLVTVLFKQPCNLVAVGCPMIQSLKRSSSRSRANHDAIRRSQWDWTIRNMAAIVLGAFIVFFETVERWHVPLAEGAGLGTTGLPTAAHHGWNAATEIAIAGEDVCSGARTPTGKLCRPLCCC